MTTLTNDPAGRGAENTYDEVRAQEAHTEARRRDVLWAVSVALAVVGTLVSAYLSYAKATNIETVCIQGVGNCAVVQSSVYSYLLGIPVAYIGLAGYISILGVLLLEKRIPFFAARGRLLVMLMTLGGFLFSAYLTAIEAFVLYEWCQWCVISALVMTILFGVSFARLWQSMNQADDEATPEAES
jgi:uncharacterized membrane protein